MRFFNSIKLFLIVLLATTPAIQSHEQRNLAPLVALAAALGCTTVACLAYYVYATVSNKEDIINQPDSDEAADDNTQDTQNQTLQSFSPVPAQRTAIKSSFKNVLKNNDPRTLQNLLKTTQPIVNDVIFMLEDQNAYCSVDLFLAVRNNTAIHQELTTYLTTNKSKLNETYQDICEKTNNVDILIATLLKNILINSTTISTADDLFIDAIKFVVHIDKLNSIAIRQQIFTRIYGLECTNKNYNRILFTELNKTLPSPEKLATLILYLPITTDWLSSGPSFKKYLLIDALWNNKKLQNAVRTYPVDHEYNNLITILKNLIQQMLPEEYRRLFGNNPLKKQYTQAQKVLHACFNTTVISAKATWHIITHYYTHMHNAFYPPEQPTQQPPKQQNKKNAPRLYYYTN